MLRVLLAFACGMMWCGGGPWGWGWGWGTKGGHGQAARSPCEGREGRVAAQECPCAAAHQQRSFLLHARVHHHPILPRRRNGRLGPAFRAQPHAGGTAGMSAGAGGTCVCCKGRCCLAWRQHTAPAASATESSTRRAPSVAPGACTWGIRGGGTGRAGCTGCSSSGDGACKPGGGRGRGQHQARPAPGPLALRLVGSKKCGS
jgi:hypothetical protein